MWIRNLTSLIALLQGEDHDEETIAFLKKAGEQPVHIFICTDDTDFRPIAVLVNSTLSNALWELLPLFLFFAMMYIFPFLKCWDDFVR